METSHLNSLPTLRIQNDAFEAEILLQGAQLMHFAPRGQRDWIFRSPNTPYTPRREIYSGVPVIFPWFGRLEEFPEAGGHGFVRQATWKPEPGQSDAQITLSLTADEVREQGIDTTFWPYDFIARMIFSFGETLGLHLEISNQSGEPFRFECAFHPYFQIENLAAVRVEGLDGQLFRSGERGGIETQSGPITFGPPTTQFFDSASVPTQIHDQNRTFHLTPREGCRSTIAWNPGGAMADLSAADAQSFVCVEAGAIQNSAISLDPGQTYALDFSIQATENTKNSQRGTENN